MLWLLLVALAPAPCVELVRAPSFWPEQEIVRIQIRVERHEDHRLLVLAAFDGDVIVRRTDEQLAGEASPRTRWVEWRLPEGELTLAAIVYNSEDEIDRDTHRLTVYGRVGY